MNSHEPLWNSMTVIGLLCVSNRQQNLCAKEQRKSGIYITYAHKCNQFQSKSYLVSFARNLIPSSDKFNFGLQPLTIFLLVTSKAISGWICSHGHLLTYDYLISPMKMRSFEIEKLIKQIQLAAWFLVYFFKRFRS